jgi:hypothetical protein
MRRNATRCEAEGHIVTTQRGRLGWGRQLIGWITAYALVLNAVLAGAIGVQLAANAAAGFELCLTHPDGAPAPAQDQHQHDQCALHCAALTGFVALAVALIAFAFPQSPMSYARRRSRYLAPTAFLCRAGKSRAPPLPA